LQDDQEIVDAYRKRLPVPLPPSSGSYHRQPIPLGVDERINPSDPQVVSTTSDAVIQKDDEFSKPLQNDDIVSTIRNFPIIGAIFLWLICSWIKIQKILISMITIPQIKTKQNTPKPITSDRNLTIKLAAKKKGMIYLVGSGPGDPDLLVLRAKTLIETADIVVSDRLISPAILAMVQPSRLHLAMWKTNGKSEISQELTNQKCLDFLRNGKVVVRLKSGDPMIFGRGAEEVA
jgi:hypothetical protein